ncbi:MAG: hypothetical protein KatS3mg019_0791 [Fimbriimonadales bacterium]|nr:MAG: hypothetical protein KatS3mg019_0791 [Fimbriimonadales bacterium]
MANGQSYSAGLEITDAYVKEAPCQLTLAHLENGAQNDFSAVLPEQRFPNGEEAQPPRTVSFRKAVPHIPSTTYGVFSLYRYPAKFIPQAVAYVIERYATRGSSVIDPFAGSGTTGLVARLYGLDYELWDLNPLLDILHRIAVMRPLPLRLTEVVDAFKYSDREWLPQWSRLHYWYPEAIRPLLSKVWGYYHSIEEEALRLFVTVPLLKVTKQFSYNDPQRQKLSRSPKALARVETLIQSDYEKRFFDFLTEELNQVICKIHEYQSLLGEIQAPQSRVIAGANSLTVAQNLPPEAQWDMLITSPPYLQAQEYIRCSKLDLLWLGYTEEQVRALAKEELPYKKVEPCPIYSATYESIRAQIHEAHLRSVYEQYFYAVLGTLSRLAEHVQRYMCLFVGQATVRGKRVPIDVIFAEHFQSLGWTHEATLIDTIEARVLFKARINPATGIEDHRMPTEHMVILRR